MAISLQNILRFAENSGQNPDGSPFDQRSLGYGDNPPLILKDLPKVDQETNGALDLIGQVTDNFVRGGVIALGKSAVDDVKRLGKVLISPNGLAWSAAQLALTATNPKNLISPRNRLTLPIGTLLTAGTGAAGIRFRKDGLVDVKTESGFNYDKNKGGPKYESSLLEIINKGEDVSSDHTIYGALTNIYRGGFEGREDLIKSYGGGAHSVFGIGRTEIKKYKSNPYSPVDKTLGQTEKEGYLPLFNRNFFELRQGPNKSKTTSGTPKYVDYRTARGLPTPVKGDRIGLYRIGDPGIEMDNGEGYGAYNSRTIDKISAANIFKRQGLETFKGEFKDYIKFRIAVVDTENPLNDNVI